MTKKTSYGPSRKTNTEGMLAPRLLVLLIGCGLLVAVSALLGPVPLAWSDVLDITGGNPFWTLRAPRALLAAVAGAGLALGGVVFQVLFRNPLATPYTLGVASGASLAAALGLLMGTVSARGVPLSLLAFLGAMVAMALVYLMGRLRGGRDIHALLLAGVCVAYIGSAGIVLVTYIADQAITNEIVQWLMGSLTTVGWRPLLEILVLLVPVLLIFLRMHRALDNLTLGDDVASARGVDVDRTVWLSFTLIGLLTAGIVAHCGPIGFVGLIVPHLTRQIVGPRTLPLICGATLVGGAFLALCDGFARLPAYEIPVGVITNILGAGFFFYLLARSGAQR